jgi:hypothetical protein
MATTSKSRAKNDSKSEMHAAAERALELLRDDPPRLKRLLREAAGLADDLSQVLEDAGEDHYAKQLSRGAKLVRGGAILPAGMAVALIRKGLDKAFAR